MGKEQELLDAARNGNLAVVERILNHRIKRSGPLASLRRGPGPNTQDASGYTCLHHAALNGHKDVVALLLSYDANPNITDNKGSTTLHLAAWTGNHDIVETILVQSSMVPNVNQRNNDQETPLHCAAQYGHTSVVSLLLQHGSDPFVRNLKEESSLDLAAQYGRLETVDVLLRARPNLVTDLVRKHSPLHLAARNGHRGVIKILLDAKFDVNYLTDTGSALHEAALYGKIEVVKLLLEYGVDTDLEDHQKRTVMDLLNELHTNIAKQTKRLIREHTTLVNTDDSSTIVSDNSSHCISPPPGYTDNTPEHVIYTNILHPENVTSPPERNYTPTNAYTSPANSEFSFYDVPPPPRLSVVSKRSSGTSDDYRSTRSAFSRSTDSILDGCSTSSSRSPSFLDYEAGPPLPPRDRLASTRATKSSDSADLLYEVPLPPPNLKTDHQGYGVIYRKDPGTLRSNCVYDDDLPKRPDSQSSNGTWSNHSSGYVQMSGRPTPPAKPPRKSISPLNRALSQQQYQSKSQHQLNQQQSRTSAFEYIMVSSTNEGNMKRSASNEGDGYVDMKSFVPSNQSSNHQDTRFSTFLGHNNNNNNVQNQQLIDSHKLMSESAFSILYDEIANGTSTMKSPTPPPLPVKTMSSLSRNYTKPAKPLALQHIRSKSEHHPRCPNFEQGIDGTRIESSNDSTTKGKRATIQIPITPTTFDKSSIDGILPPSPSTAAVGLHSVIGPLIESDDSLDSLIESDPETDNIGCNCDLYSESKEEFVPNGFGLHAADDDYFECFHDFVCNNVNPSHSSPSELSECSDEPSDSDSFLTCHCIELHDYGDCLIHALEYRRMSRQRSVDSETSTEDLLLSSTTSKSSGSISFYRDVKEPIAKESKSISTDVSIEYVNNDENPFTGLCRGSVRSTLGPDDGRKSLRKQKHYNKRTLERKRRSSKNYDEDSTLIANKSEIPAKSEIKAEPQPELRLNFVDITTSENSETKLTNSTEISVLKADRPITAPLPITASAVATTTPVSSSLSLSPFDENAEWAEIANIVASFGSSIAKDFESEMEEYTVELKKSDDAKEESNKEMKLSRSVPEWLASLNVSHLSEVLVVNGFDNLRFMGPNVMDEQDLIEIGITNVVTRETVLKASQELPPTSKLAKVTNLTVDEWLKSISLYEYIGRFKDNGFIDMDRVRNIWEVELNAVLEINKLGHRKRILSSLGERLSLVDDLGLGDLDFDKMNLKLDDLEAEEKKLENDLRKEIENEAIERISQTPSPFKSEADITDSEITVQDSEPDITLRGSVNSSPSSRISSHSTGSLSLNTQWKHDPTELVSGSCSYAAQYLGSTLVRELQGFETTRESIKKLKESTKDIKKIPSVILSISYTGVKFIDAQTNQMVCEHEIRNIHCACQDADDFNHFAYITKEIETNNHYCHVFCAVTLDLATEIILTLGQAFDVAYQMALGGDIKTMSRSYRDSMHPAEPPPPPPRTTSTELIKCIVTELSLKGKEKDANNRNNKDNNEKEVAASSVPAQSRTKPPLERSSSASKIPTSLPSSKANSVPTPSVTIPSKPSRSMTITSSSSPATTCIAMTTATLKSSIQTSPFVCHSSSPSATSTSTTTTITFLTPTVKPVSALSMPASTLPKPKQTITGPKPPTKAKPVVPIKPPSLRSIPSPAGTLTRTGTKS